MEFSEREMLESMLMAAEIAIDRVNDYRLGGGLERVTETADEMRKLGTLQSNLILKLLETHKHFIANLQAI